MQSDAARKAAKRAAERDLRISPVVDWSRRKACLEDTTEFLRVYFPSIFSQAFTKSRLDMIAGIEHAARYGGDQSIAAPRGDGKTRSALFVTLKLLLEDAIRFPLIISKSGPRANRELKNFKFALKSSQGLLEDFPEVVEPIISLGGWSSRARQQTAFGEFTELEWGEDCIILPTIKSEHLGYQSAATGQIMASLGIEGPIRGYCVRDVRPDVAILDDIDDRESARSELQTEARETIIEEDVGGLAGPDKTVARVMLCTLLNHSCCAATYTDRSKKPSWRGQRHKLLSVLPERTDLWEEYIGLRQGRGEDDPDARKAHEFYIENREQMDRGAEVTNPQRFDGRPLADGEPGQVSALQACYDLIADRGWDSFNTEYQNDPPEEDGPIESGISAGRIQRQLSGYPRRVIPPDCVCLSRGIDVQKAGVHWVIKAWRSDATNYIIDYGFFESHGTKYGSDDGLEFAVRAAIKGCMELSETEPYATIDGKAMPIDMTLVDSGWQSPAVYQACQEIGLGVYPSKGHGKSHGCATPNFHDQFNRTKDRKPGDGWFMSRLNGSNWLVHCDTDRWKSFEHARWMTAEGKPGCSYLFGEITDEERRYIDKRLPRDSKEHYSFAKHITAEVETEDVVRGKMVRIWKVKAGRVQNHYLDASYLADVAAGMQGIRLLGEMQTKRLPPAERPSARDLARMGA